MVTKLMRSCSALRCLCCNNLQVGGFAVWGLIVGMDDKQNEQGWGGLEWHMGLDAAGKEDHFKGSSMDHFFDSGKLWNKACTVNTWQHWQRR